jgi:hypothetical protein
VSDSKLNGLLRRLTVPERSEMEWKEAAEKTMRKIAGVCHSRGPFGELPPVSSQYRVSASWRLARWTAGVATACVIVGFILGQWHGRRGVRRDEVAEARKLFSELNVIFPDQVKAVVLDGSSPRLTVADAPQPNRGIPLFVRVCGRSGCQRIITFSGERVRLNGGDCDVLLDAAGNIIIIGERFVWSSAGQNSRNNGYRIQAAPLAGIL